jgi:hypothetical protein
MESAQVHRHLWTQFQGRFRRVRSWLHRTWDALAAVLRSPLMQAIFGLCLVAMAGLGAVLVVDYGHKVVKLQQCQENHYRALILANKERADAAALDRAAIRTFLTSISDPQATPEGRRLSYETYLHALDTADARRAANPLPEPGCNL